MFENTSSYSSISHQQQFLALFQTQNRICSQYIKLASEKLYLNQATRISQANDLLEKLTVKQKVKDLSQWDIFSTRDSVILQDDSSFNLSNISVDSKSKLISRKNALGSRTARDFDGNINESLQEIERECSPKTTNLIRKLADEYKRMKNRAQDNEKKQKSSKMNEKVIEQLREKHIILLKKIQDLQSNLEKLKTENSHLKSENKDLNDSLFKKTHDINSDKKIKLYEEIANNKILNNSSSPKKNSQPYAGNFDILHRLVEEKEKRVVLRYQQIRSIEAKIEETLFKDDNSCINCCTMLKKIKNSIISYKKYLEKEGEEFEGMVDSYKFKILTHEKQNR